MMVPAENDVVARVEEGLAGTFTRYVRALAERSDAREALFEDVWQELRRVLTRELHWRSLWSSPPSFVGLYGWESWSAAGSDLGEVKGPLAELLPDCYLSIFHRQLPGLLSQLRVGTTIDGLVVFFVRNFLSQRQKDHDPLGYRIFEILRSAVRDSIATGELHVVRSRRPICDNRILAAIRNDTVLAVSPDADPADAAPAEDLRPIVERWNDDLLPGLVTAGGQERRQVVERLQRHLFDLESEGVAVFRFKDLIDPLKHDVRSRWSVLYELGEGQVLRESRADDGGASRDLIPVFHPQNRVEEIDSFRKLVGCVAELIERLDESARTRRYLETLWSFLRRFAFDVTVEGLPAHRKVGKELHIPRERLPALYAKIGELIRRCQATLSGAVVDLDRIRRRQAGGRNG